MRGALSGLSPKRRRAALHDAATLARQPGARTWRENARQGIHSGKKERGESLRARSLL
jgi:hypothetical protein